MVFDLSLIAVNLAQEETLVLHCDSHKQLRSRRGRDRMVVEITTTYTTSA
jgi:hypothetical protein